MKRHNAPVGRIAVHSIGHEAPGFVRDIRRRGARRRGQIYEQRVHEELERRYPTYLGSLWFGFQDDEGSKWCQPDGLLLNPWKGLITILEIKYQHTPQAHEQLFDIYAPVVAAAFPEYDLRCVEVVKWFDPFVRTQRKPHLCEDLARAKPFAFNVHILPF